jgi:tetratricopeptide (TPR) repeat protein
MALFSAWILICVCSQQNDESFTQGIGLYNQNELEKSLPYFKTATEKTGDSETFAYLSETYRRLGMKEEALGTAEKSLEADPCNSFAHVTLSYLYNPMYGDWKGANREKAWAHIQKGIECDPNDGNVWLAAWTEAIYRKDREIEGKSLKMLIDTGFLTPAILAFNRWMLQHLPQDAILLTNGDMDTYPAVALQETEGFRSDVTVMNYSLLNTRWYQQHIQNRYDVKFPLSGEELDNLKATKYKKDKIKTVASRIMGEIIKAKAENRFERPLAISITVGDFSFAEGFEDHFVLMGAFNLWNDEGVETNYDLDAVKNSLESLNINDFAGPFVNAADKSPVRMVSTRKIALNFPNLAILVIKEKMAQSQRDEALDMLQWALQVEKVVIREPEMAAKLEQIKSDILAEKE